MTFTPADLIAIATGIAAIIAALGAAIASVITARAVRPKHAEISDKADAIGDKVDGAAAASVATIKELRQEIAMLHAGAAEKKETAALLAQAAVRPPAPPVSADGGRRATDKPTDVPDPQGETP
jgi:hypothetical protein